MHRILTFIFLMMFCQPATATGVFLSAVLIKDRLNKGELVLKTGDDYEFPIVMNLKSDGSVEGKSSNGYFDVGRWWLHGDTLCHRWENWFDGLRKCHGVMADDDGLTLVKPNAKHFKNANTRLK